MAFWTPYVPVAKRRARARREMNQLRKTGKDIQPVDIEGRTIARSFWGKGWCEHLESFSDYANRLPRGRTYVRNGSVCHLEIRPGRIEAIVSGSELYTITIAINGLKTATWKAIKAQCAGQIGSVLELLQGKLSGQVMDVVTHRDKGLFPKPGEIKLACSCPDWATMCKHVAAVLYGVGSRLDNQPELLFVLRNVDAAELIATDIALPGGAVTRDTLAAEALGDIFGIDLDTEEAAPPAPKAVRPTRAKPPRPAPRQKRAVSAARRPPQSAANTPDGVARAAPARGASKTTSKAARRTPASQPKTPPQQAADRVVSASPSSFRPTGASVLRLRRRHGLTVAQFANRLGVSAGTVYRWETTAGRLNLQPRPLHALWTLHRQTRQLAR